MANRTSLASAIKIVIDAMNSLLTDANFIFYPYYIEESDDSPYEENNHKNIGGIVVKEVNKTGKILVYMRLDADKFDIYKYNYNKKKLTLGIDINNLLKELNALTWIQDEPFGSTSIF